MAPLALLFGLLVSVPVEGFSGDAHKLTAEPGEDIHLPCLCPRDAVLSGIAYSRSDLKTDKYVFFFRENRPCELCQLPSYCGRVELRHPDMKDGDVSVVLKNVSVNDTGTYQCRCIINGTTDPLVTNITLNVTHSGHTGGDQGDKDGGDKTGGDKDGKDKDGGDKTGKDKDGGVILAILGPPVIVICIALYFLFCHKKSSETPVASENAENEERNILIQNSTPFIDPPNGDIDSVATAREIGKEQINNRYDKLDECKFEDSSKCCLLPLNEVSNNLSRLTEEENMDLCASSEK